MHALLKTTLLIIAVALMSGCGGVGRAAGDSGTDEGIGAPNDIVDLIRAKKIEADPQGQGIQSVGLRVRRLVKEPVTVHVPVGTYLVSANPSAQNMISTSEGNVTLDNDEWTTINLSAACANRPRHIPGTGDKFAVRRAPNRAELSQLMPALNAANPAYETRQAAVWIVSDNASYGDMGILVSSMSRRRVIGAAEAAAAMRICDQAGINIKSKAIWRDRQEILRSLEDGELKRWLAAKV